MRKRTFLIFVCCVIVIILFSIGLLPFSFWPSNDVSLLPGRQGINFYGNGVIYSEDLIETSKLFSDGELSIELWIEPDIATHWHKDNWRYAQLLTLYDSDERFEVLSIGQWNSSIDMYSYNTLSKSYKKVSSVDFIPKNKAVLITVTSNRSETNLFMNGKHVQGLSNFSLVGKGNETVRLIVGNSSTGKIPWQGTVLGLAVYNSVLTPTLVVQQYNTWIEHGTLQDSSACKPLFTYPLGEREQSLSQGSKYSRSMLIIPKKLKVFHHLVLISPKNEVRLKFSFFKDAFINLTGFVPFGFFIFALLGSYGKGKYRTVIAVVLFGAVISLTIELLQVYLPTRSSSLTDLILNTSGTVIGAFAYSVVGSYVYKSR